MKKNDSKSARELWFFWKGVLDNPLPAVKDIHKKETLFLKKNIKRGSFVLDVGCGGGRNIKDIINIAKKVIGIDYYEEACEEAKKELSRFKNTEVLLAKAEKMPLRDNSFDYVICMGNTFGNFRNNKVKILKEIKRLVKKDGKIIIGVYSEKASVIRLKQYRKAGAYLKKINKDGTFLLRDGTISEQFSPIKLKRIFKKAGLIPKLTTLGKFAYICEAKK